MGINAAGLELIKSLEGLRLTAYKCSAGVWTIGWGHTGKVDGRAVGKGMKISKAKAEELLRRDLEGFYAKTILQTYVPVAPELNENQRAALTSFAFNTGCNNLKTLCKGRSVAEIADALLLYNKDIHKRYNQGLADRRKKERALFLTPAGKSTSIGRDYALGILRRGDSGQQVQALQKLLGIVSDGAFGPATETAVTIIQQAHGLEADGVVGPLTWAVVLK